MKIKIDDLILGKNWSRTFGTGDITDLAATMAEHGQITPVVVNSAHELLAGYRRVAAAKSLGWEEITVMYNDETSPKVLNLIENLHRDDPSLWEEIQALRDVFGTDPKTADVCRQLSKGRNWARPRIEVWDLPKAFITKVRLGHATISDIRQMLTEKRGPSAQSKNMGHPSQPDIKRMITWLVAEGRVVEAKVLSFAIGGLSEQDLKDLMP
jgi:ParB/RepB/Spo0J family partition protein